MPTYRNDSAENIGVRKTDGSDVTLKPGESIETEYANSAPGITRTAWAPMYNSVLAAETVALSVDESYVDIEPGTRTAIVVQITGSVTVYRDDATNTPPELSEYTSDWPVIQMVMDGRTSRLVLTGSGTCRVQQYNR